MTIDLTDMTHDSTITPAELVNAIRAVQPIIAAQALQTEQDRKVTDVAFAAVEGTGVFRHFVPRHYGGLQFGVDDFVDVVLPLAEVCASTAWVTAFCMEHNLILSLFPEQAQEEIFAAQPYILSPGAAFPPGRAVPEGSGFRVSGRWTYASAIMHADWIMAMAVVEGDNAFDIRWFLTPRSTVEVHDVWFVDGLAGTGSNDFTMDDVFVPRQRSLDVLSMSDGTAPGSSIHDSPVYRLPMATFLALTAALPAIGAARGGLDLFRDRLANRVSTGAKQADRQTVQAVLGRVDVEVHLAEVMIREAAHDLVALAEQGESGNVPARARLRARLAYATNLARDALRTMVDVSGSSVHLLDHPLQRAARDAAMATGHVLHDLAAATELSGRTQLGIEPNTFLI